MTPGARRILQDLVAGNDLIRDGIHAYCGPRPVASRVVSELIWIAAIDEVGPSDGFGAKYYQISSMGHSYLRRPELEQEYMKAVMCGRGAWTIRDDRLVPLDED